jgi:hypothetical protein
VYYIPFGHAIPYNPVTGGLKSYKDILKIQIFPFTRNKPKKQGIYMQYSTYLLFFNRNFEKGGKTFFPLLY